MSRNKITAQSGYVLHTRPYMESSLLVEVFTREHGRLTLISKGSRRKLTRSQGMYVGFKPLLISWVGKGDLPILTSIEQQGHFQSLKQSEIGCGYYINELILKLLHRHDSHEKLFDKYHDLIISLSEGKNPFLLLRIFEKHLLQEIGFGLVLSHDVETGEEIRADSFYVYVPQKGPITAPSQNSDTICGETLIGLKLESFKTEAQMKQARWLTRSLIDIQLAGKKLKTRKIFTQMRHYKQRCETVSS